MTGRDQQRGQALPLILALGCLILAAAVVVFGVGRAYAAKSDAQAAADLVAVGTARELARNLPRLAIAQTARERRRWERRLSTTAADLARRNGVRLERVVFMDRNRWPATIVQVRVAAAGPVGATIPAAAQAEIRAGAGSFTDTAGTPRSTGEYRGPLVLRQGKPTCPAVATAFDRMAAAAAGNGVHLVINSAFRSDREQALLYAAHPDPKWVAPPGRSRHRDATELDLAGTPGAWTWLATHARSFGFTQRYSWEPWHYGYLPGCGAAAPRDARAGAGAPHAGGDQLPGWVPAEYRPTILEAARQGGVPPIVVAALLKAESNFNPRAVSPAGAQGIAQFMPATARGMGLRDPFAPHPAIMAAGRLLGGHLRDFGSIPLALAAYNAGGGAVRRYGGVPPFAETRAYVARILALAGDLTVAPAGGGQVVLTRIDDLLV